MYEVQYRFANDYPETTYYLKSFGCRKEAEDYAEQLNKIVAQLNVLHEDWAFLDENVTDICEYDIIYTVKEL